MYSICPDFVQELWDGLCIDCDLFWSSLVISFPCPKELDGHQVWGLAIGEQEVGQGWAASGLWGGLQVGHG